MLNLNGNSVAVIVLIYKAIKWLYGDEFKEEIKPIVDSGLTRIKRICCSKKFENAVIVFMVILLVVSSIFITHDKKEDTNFKQVEIQTNDYQEAVEKIISTCLLSKPQCDDIKNVFLEKGFILNTQGQIFVR